MGQAKIISLDTQACNSANSTIFMIKCLHIFKKFFQKAFGHDREHGAHHEARGSAYAKFLNFSILLPIGYYQKLYIF